MSRGLGPQQIRALDLVDLAATGITRPHLSGLLGLSPRRGRKLVAALVDRDLVTVDPSGLVWLRERRAAWCATESRRELYRAMEHHSTVVRCKFCAATFEVMSTAPGPILRDGPLSRPVDETRMGGKPVRGRSARGPDAEAVVPGRTIRSRARSSP